MPQPGSSEWIIKCATPNKLVRNGITRDSVPVGTLVVVEGYWEDEGKHTIIGTKVSLPDGRVLAFNSLTAAEEPWAHIGLSKGAT